MKSIRSLFILSLITGILLLGSVSAFAGVESNYEPAAKDLYEFGLLQGSDDSLAINIKCTKLECAVMLVRILGAENYVASNEDLASHGFNDVPKWANGYINYLQSQDLITGNSETTFGSENETSADVFALMFLRALDYNDFDLSTALDYTETIGLFTKEEISQLKSVPFTRGTLAFMARRMLDTPISEETGTTFLDILSLSGILQNNSTSDMPSMTKVIPAPAPAPTPAAPAVDNHTAKTQSILSQASSCLGVRYRSGGTSPAGGFDCSGFVNYVLTKTGAHSQWYGGCDSLHAHATAISASQAKAGDLVFFSGTYSTSKRYTHVGIYLGNGKMIHASSSKGVSYANIYDSYWSGHLAGFARW